MLKISRIENIIITPDACEFILNISNNSIRILVNYLEKLKLLEEVVGHLQRNNMPKQKKDEDNGTSTYEL